MDFRVCGVVERVFVILFVGSVGEVVRRRGRRVGIDVFDAYDYRF